MFQWLSMSRWPSQLKCHFLSPFVYLVSWSVFYEWAFCMEVTRGNGNVHSRTSQQWPRWRWFVLSLCSLDWCQNFSQPPWNQPSDGYLEITYLHHNYKMFGPINTVFTFSMSKPPFIDGTQSPSNHYLYHPSFSFFFTCSIKPNCFTNPSFHKFSSSIKTALQD